LFLSGMLVLAACERPAQTAPEVENDPNSATLGDDKPEETLENPVDAYPAPGDGTNAGEAPAVEPTAEPVPTVEPTPEPPTEVIHEVQSGETLLAISLIYGVEVQDIVRANSLTSADVLDVGQKLIIPVGGFPDEVVGEETGGETAVPEATAEPAGEQIHIVQSGETLFRIALAYGTTVDALATYNNLVNPDRLEVGQEIRIPAGGN
jgi:LysM repeat protein